MADSILINETAYKSDVAVYYVNVDNNYKPHLSAAPVDANGQAPRYVVNNVTYWNTEDTSINSDGATKQIFFPPYESSLALGDWGRTPTDALNWHQFLAHLRFKKHTYPSATSNGSLVTTVVYKLFGTRILVDAYEHNVGNDEFGYDIPIGFDPNTYYTTDHNFSYVNQDGSDPGTSVLSMPNIVITSHLQTPWVLQFDELNGLALRFLAFGTNVTFANGMIQTSEGESLDVNSDIVFERLIPHPNDRTKWLSVNDAYYGYAFSGLTYGDENIIKYPDLYSYDMANRQYSPRYAMSGGNSKWLFDNMWISSSGYLGMYMSPSIRFLNSTIRSDFTLSTYRNTYDSISFENCILVCRDDGFEDFGSNIHKEIQPYTIDGSVVCWNSRNAGDPSGTFIKTFNNVQTGYKRGVFVSEVQDAPPDLPPPASVFTSAVADLGSDLSRISYLHEDFSGITLTSENLTINEWSKFRGISYDGATLDDEVQSNSYVIDYVVSQLTDSVAEQYVVDKIYLNVTNRIPKASSTQTFQYRAASIYIDGYYSFENLWYTVDDSTAATCKNFVVRDGVGALYFPTYFPEFFDISLTSYEQYPSIPFNATVYDGTYSGFVSSFSPSVYNWGFDKVGNANVSYTSASTSATTPMTISTLGSYNSYCYVVSNKGFYSCRSKDVLSFVQYGEPAFSVVLLNTDGTYVTNVYAGRDYLLSATNTSVYSDETIKRFLVLYGNNTPYSSTNPNTSVAVWSTDRASNESNIGQFVTSGNSLTSTIRFNDSFGWANIDCLAFGFDGSYLKSSLTKFVEVKEDVYFVDLSLEYENSKEQTLNSFFSDDFETGSFQTGWSNNFTTFYNLKDMWGDFVAYSPTNKTVQLFNKSISGDFDVKFSIVRDVTTQASTFVVSFSDGSKLDIIWDSIAKTISIFKSSVLVISKSLYDYVNDLRCPNSIRSIDFHIERVGGVVSVSYILADGWSSFSTLGYMGSDCTLSYTGSTGMGLGYFNGESDSGFPIIDGTTEDYPLTFSQFRTRLNSTGMLYDKYYCRGYRLVNSNESITVGKNTTILAWSSLSDPIKYGPWVLAFAAGSNTVVDFTKARMRDGIIYNTTTLGKLTLGTVFDVFAVWSGIPTDIKQKADYWKGSRHKLSKIVGSTIKTIME